MAVKLPRTLESLRSIVALYNLNVPGRAKVAAFAFRDAIRTFYEEISGRADSHKPDNVRHALAQELQDQDSGAYLEASISLLEAIYRPVAASVYGRGGDAASLNLWLRSAADAMAAVVTAWLRSDPSMKV
jgi:predicted RNA-binding Zn ribbon-like protein